MDFIKEKIRVMSEKLNDLRIAKLFDVEFDCVYVPEYKKSNTPPSADADWKPFKSGERLSGVDQHYWFHFKIDALPKKADKEYRISVKTGREGQWDACNPQGLVYLNGVTTQALDVNHTWLAIAADTDYDVYIYFYTGMAGGMFDVSIQIVEADLPVEQLYFDVAVPNEALGILKEGSYDYIKIRDALDKALINLDLREFHTPEFYESIEKTRKYLKEEFYEKVCGSSEATVNCIGHTHIDVAWLWTVAQTREKAQRSFSTVVNLMERFEDYKFMSSQPQLYQYVKEQDPELYSKIKEYVKQGRWEVEGAMWLEADCNLISGESMVRQILYGKRFMKDEFGVESDILWLPDVFGYSAALPQILKKSNVNRFFTSKLSWSETNSMPHDTFIWEGIDGSEVFTDLIETYVQKLDCFRMHKTWNSYKDKSYTDTTLVTFGYGDGGGGPTPEMLENHKRLKHGLPGIPKTVIGKAKDYFDKVEKDFTENAKLLKYTPKWADELYLEMHRGTYTSIAKNKKNNRKSELGIMQAETLSAWDMVNNNGVYPESTFREDQTTVLLNQFHDIIPGSSIKEVYDVTDPEYAKILSDMKSISDEKLDSLAASLNTDGGVLVYNPTPFEVSDIVNVDGKSVNAQNIPAHGWKVVSGGEYKSEVKTTKNTIENNLLKVTFDDKYHIVSIYDKKANREVIAPDAKANVLELFEDYPREYDAWEITSYYKQKMWIADDVSEVNIIPDGLKIKRAYKNSVIEQEITLRDNSKRIDFKTKIDWHEDHVLLKAAFPVDIHARNARYDIQFGSVERPTHHNTSWDEAKFEVCGHKWADLSEGDYGVALLNDCKYGYNVEENVMKLSLLKAATYPNPVADREVHEFTYSIYPHTGDFKSGEVVKEAYLLNMPLLSKEISAQSGNTPDNAFIVKSDCDNVVIETIKKAEDDNSIIVRMYDAYNKKSTATITCGFNFKKAYICNLLEENEQELESCENSVKLPVKNFEIVTLKFEI